MEVKLSPIRTPEPTAYRQVLSEPLLANGIETVNTYFSLNAADLGDGSLGKKMRAMLLYTSPSAKR
jgi:hypothetical protein